MNHFGLIVTFFLANALFSGVKAKTDNMETIFLRLCIGSDVNVDRGLKNATLLVPKMQNDRPTVLYIHGFTESVESKSVNAVISAYLKRNDHNLLVVDYRMISRENYVKVVKNAEDVATALADALTEMVNEGLNSEKLHIVGHSLGAQVAGYIARKVSFEIPRITGLDPAGPFFNFIESYLTSADARFVDIIHTDYGFYGITRTSGNVDFFPNGGRRLQPGCPSKPPIYSEEDFCSHKKSWQFYSESLLNESAFLGIMCQNYFQFVHGECSKDNVIPMGFPTPNDVAKGSYYLSTKGASPYGLGDEGIRYHDVD